MPLWYASARHLRPLVQAHRQLIHGRRWRVSRPDIRHEQANVDVLIKCGNVRNHYKNSSRVDFRKAPFIKVLPSQESVSDPIRVAGSKAS